MKERSTQTRSPMALLMILLFCLFGGLLLTGLGTMAISWALGIPLEAQEGINDAFIANLSSLKIVQLVSQIGLFIVPALLFAFRASKKPFQFLGFHTQHISPNQWVVGSILTAVLIIGALPFLARLMQWNMELHLPSFLSEVENWMRSSEEQLSEMTEAFLKMDNIGDLLFNLLIVAVTPAIAEEMLFRGALQPTLHKIFKNVHVAILLTAIIFSAIHMQFLGFFPRMFIGMYLGYLFYWSGSLWFPILGHFINNGIQVIAVYAGAIEAQEAANTTETVPLLAALFSLMVLCVSAYYFKRQFRQVND